MFTKKTVLELLASCLLYSLIVVSIDFVLLFFLQGVLNQIIAFLSFVLLLEGGIGLVVGGAAVSYSSLSAKVSEFFFHSEPWNAKRQKEVEEQAKLWIITAFFLVFAALLLSAV